MADDFDPYREWLHLDVHGQHCDHYRLLDIEPYCDDMERIRQAAAGRINLLRAVRPGKHVEHWARILDELTEARNCLVDSARKTAYDAQLGGKPSEQAVLAPAPRRVVGPLRPGANPLPPNFDEPPVDAPTAAPNVPSVAAHHVPAMPNVSAQASTASAGHALPAGPNPAAPPPTLIVLGAGAAASAVAEDPMAPVALPPGHNAQADIDAVLGLAPSATATPTPGEAKAAAPTRAAILPAPAVQHSNRPIPVRLPPSAASPTPNVATGQNAPAAAPAITPSVDIDKERKTRRMILAAGSGIAACALIALGISLWWPGKDDGNQAVGRDDSDDDESRESNDQLKTTGPAREPGKEIDAVGDDSKTTEPKADQPKSTNPKTTEPKSDDPKTDQPRTTEPKTTEPITTEPKNTEPKTDDPKTTEPKTTEPKTTEPKTTEPKTTEPKTTEPKTTEPKTDEPNPATPRTSPEDLVKMTKALADAKESIGLRKLNDAKAKLEIASGVAVADEHKAMVRRLELVHHYVTEFWLAVRQGLNGLEGEMKLDDTFIYIVEATPDRIVFKHKGSNRSYQLFEIPSRVALALAERALDAKAKSTKVILGAFLWADPQSEPEQAKTLWDEAALVGADVEELLPVLNDKYDVASLPTPRAVPKQGPLPDAATQAAALEQVKKKYAKERRATARPARHELAKLMVNEAGGELADGNLRFAFYTEALDLAVRGSPAPFIAATVDEMAKWYAIDALEYKSDALVKAGAGVPSATAKEVVLEALSVVDEAVKQERPDVALRLVKSAQATARKARDPDLSKRAGEKAKEIEQMAKAKKSPDKDKAAEKTEE